jgi:hypothetical protein
MSRNIDVSDPSKLSEAEAVYAHSRNLLTDDQMKKLGYDPDRAVLTDAPLQFQTHTGDANTHGLTQADLDKRVVDEEELEPAEENLTEPQIEDDEEPTPLAFDDDEDEDEDDEDDEEEVEYSSMTNEQLRIEIVRRNEGRAPEDELSTEGNKKTLIATLEEDDTSEG